MSKASGRPLKLVYLTEEAGYTQRKTQEAVLGNMFKVSNCFVKQPITRPPHFELGFQMELRQCNIIHNFTLTKTTVKHYYVYSHTWIDVNLLGKVRGNPGYYGNLTIATQNIWHFSHTPEIGYARRIRELGKVCVRAHMWACVYVCVCIYVRVCVCICLHLPMCLTSLAVSLCSACR